jgi:hypothetical protein
MKYLKTKYSGFFKNYFSRKNLSGGGPPNKLRFTIFAVAVSLTGLGGIFWTFADSNSTTADPNAVVLQYSLPHNMMPISNVHVQRPTYQPFTLYGNGLLVCGHSYDMQFMPQHYLSMNHDMTSAQSLPTSVNLKPNEVHDLVKQVVDTGFLDLNPEYFNEPIGGKQFTVRLNLNRNDKFVMYYGDVAMPQAYSDTLQILEGTCNTATQPYQAETVKVRTLKDASADGNLPQALNDTSSTTPVIKKSLAGADSKKSDEKKNKEFNTTNNSPSPNLAEDEQTVTGSEATELVNEYKDKNVKLIHQNNSNYEVAVAPQLPDVSNKLQVNYKEIRAKKIGVATKILNKVSSTKKAHADSQMPVRVVLMLAADGGDTSRIAHAQDLGQRAYSWYCGQIGKCYNYQGTSILRGSQTLDYYNTCHRGIDASSCSGQLDAVLDNIYSRDSGSIFRSDVDTLVVPGWATNTLSYNVCGWGFIGGNLSIIDAYTPDTGSNVYPYCIHGATTAHEQGHTFGLDHTGNGTLMDGPPYSQYAAGCDIGTFLKTCTLDSGQKTLLASGSKSYIFGNPYNAASGPAAPYYRYWNPSVADHYYTSTRNDTNLRQQGWVNYDGCEANIYTSQPAGTVALHQYWNTTTKDHYYTVYRDDPGLAASGYKYEQVAGYVYSSYSQPAGTIPLYRYWNTRLKDHLYTTVWDDYGRASGGGWVFEKVEAYVLPPQANRCFYATTPLWQYWNATGKDHFYTVSRNDSGYAGFGYRLERCVARVYTEYAPGMVGLNRYWNPTISNHFYTVDRNDAGMAYYGFRFENQEGLVYPYSITTAGIPLYRYYNAGYGDHFYTTDFNELGWGNYGWTFEKTEAFVWPTIAGSC